MTTEGIHVGQTRFGDTVPGVPPQHDVRRRGLALLALDLVAAVGAVTAAIRAYVTVEFDDGAGTVAARRWGEVMKALRCLADLANSQHAALADETKQERVGGGDA